MSEISLPMFSCRILMALSLTFKSLIHFEFILVYSVRRWPRFIIFHVSVQFSHHHLSNRLSLPHYMFLPLLSYIHWPCRCGFISGLSIRFHWSTCLFLYQCHAGLSTIPCSIVWCQVTWYLQCCSFWILFVLFPDTRWKFF